ncbi:MAG: Mrp/NBP35 family ATP-binding protein [Deltaproteobacteria bacterium]|nr:Mrp/NBP35 family ATP-binding protein [Deltaproteobacteria bacterium]MBW2139915.1 Mrp/NBP35 family ATP-binding protein [Deltaproteobacteria bacterium]MBW2322380.1 Mrp/NBP35 family ATP-binding protein [Deltaproteobacteria bacterium]
MNEQKNKPDRSEAKRQQDVVIRATLSQIKKKYLVMSGKGGVGKSCLAVNLAVCLTQNGLKGGILDVDLHGPSVPRMLGLSSQMEIAPDRRIVPQTWSENLSVISIDSMLQDRDDAVIWRGPKKLNAIRQFISDVSWVPMDFLIIDSPPGTGDEPLAVARTIPSARAIVVTTPQEVSLADVRKSIHFLEKLNITVAGLVENMSGFICPHCGRPTDLFGKGGGRILAETMNIDFLGAVPIDPGVVPASDNGRPYVLEDPKSNFAKAVTQIAAQL